MNPLATNKMANKVTQATIVTSQAAKPLEEMLKYDRNGISEFWNNNSKVEAQEMKARITFRRKSDFIAL